jgi:methanogenic corrinoid protein MtbC1
VAGALAKRALAEGIEPLDAINKSFGVDLRQVGDTFGCGEAFLPDLVPAGEAMKAAVAVLHPELAKRCRQQETAGRFRRGSMPEDHRSVPRRGQG